MGLDLMHLKPVLRSEDHDQLEYLTLSEFSDFPDFVSRHASYFVDRETDENEFEKVVYVATKGYQRKGVNETFIYDFENNRLYLDLQAVIKAYDYLMADHGNTLEELQQNFQKNFINNFVKGESIFCISW